ncbi:hypothetical protein GCM10009797_29590 [Nocardioides hwasunensis]
MARRQREQAERLQRSAALWERGADGEAAVARALEALPEGWVVLHDLAWPCRQRANLDHVVVGPSGVFVVDAKNWSGRIEVRDQVLRQNGRQREQTVSSVTAAAIAVGELVEPVPCVGVLCFVRDEPVATKSWSVEVCSTATLTTMLTARPHLLGDDDVRRCAEAIAAGAVRHPVAAVPKTAAQRRAGRSPKRRRSNPLAGLAVAAALMVALLTGGFEKATGWLSEQVSAVIVPPSPAEPAQTKPAREQRQQQKEERREGQGRS